VRALKLTNPGTRAFIKRIAPRILHGTLKNFGALEGSGVYKSLLNGERIYFSYRLVKS
jgi:hypothetical protein